jgi:YggT family protein
MTERENYRDHAPQEIRREISHTTVVDEPDAPAGAEREVYQERVSGPAGEEVVRSEHVSVPSQASQRVASVVRVKQVIYFVFGAIEALLAIRFVLLLLGASEASWFVGLIYALSRPFALPFQGIFSEPSFGGSMIAWSALVGIIVYALFAYGLARLVELIYAPARPSRTREI